MKIAISGCGIAGTAAAVFLARDGHEVHIFEQAPECKPVGAGILLQPSGLQVLEKLGIGDDIIAKSAPLDGLLAKQASGAPLVRLKYEWLNPKLIGYGVHRGVLFDTLHKLCLSENIEITTGFRACHTSDDADSKVNLHREEGSAVSGFDFVIAADGSRSSVREHLGLTKYEIDYDYAALWATGPCEYQPGTLVQVVRGTQDLVGLLPIGRGQSSFFYGLRASSYPSLAQGSIENWKSQVLSICPDAQSMLAPMQRFEDLTFTRYRHVVMKSWHNDHVLVIGDAAHATSPHLGQGASLALEDADCFAACLRSCHDFKLACQQFSRLRRWKVAYFQQLTRLLSPFFQSNGNVKGKLRDIFLPWFPKLPLVRGEMVRTLCGEKRGWIG